MGGLTMSRLLLALAVSCAPALAAELHTREVPVAVYTDDEVPVDDLKAEEIEIKEDGRTRTVLGLERDSSPVVVALILDSSEHMGAEYRASLVPAAVEFQKRLPPQARLTIWTCGGKVSHAVDFGVDPSTAEATLGEVAVGGPSFALDTMIDASRHLRRERGARRVVVIVTDMAIQANRTLFDRTYRIIARARITPMVVLVERSNVRGGGLRIGGEGEAWDIETVFEQMADGYGGSYELVLTPLAARKMLRRVAADISSQYLVRFESEAEKPSSPEVNVDRKDVRVRAGLSRIAR
jgi:hypothetical protein